MLEEVEQRLEVLEQVEHKLEVLEEVEHKLEVLHHSLRVKQAGLAKVRKFGGCFVGISGFRLIS